MPKDYQENTTAEKLAHEIAKLFDDGFTTPTFGQIEQIELLVTTYGNARVEEIIKIAEGMKYKGEPSADASDLTWCGHHEHNNTLTDLIKAIKK